MLIDTLEQAGFKNVDSLLKAFLVSLNAGQDRGLLISLEAHALKEIHQLAYVIENLCSAAFGLTTSIVTATEDLTVEEFFSKFMIRTNTSIIDEGLNNDFDGHPSVGNGKCSKEDDSGADSNASDSSKLFYRSRFNSLRLSNSTASHKMPTKSIPGPATGRKIANVVVVEFMGDIFHKIAEELRLIMLRCHVQDASLPRIFQLVVIVGANQIYHENLKPLADFMFYHMDLLEDNIPNFTGQMIRRNASIQPKLLESLSNACSSVRVSSEMHAYIRDLLTALRNDRRLCRGISARISRGFFAACQFAAMIHYRSEYLGSEHVEAAANWALCHHLHCRTGISNIKQSRAILADVICRLPKPF